MTSNTRRSLLRALLFAGAASAFGGCASEEERAIDRKYETEDERSTREVFREGWLRPKVSEDEKDFFYRSFWKSD